MEANEALAELLTLSSQVEDVAILRGQEVLACSGAPERGAKLARVAVDLLAAAAERSGEEVSRIEVLLGTSGVFVVCEGGLSAVATTVPEPTAGLVVYDLRTALRRLDEASAADAPKRRARKAAGG